MVTWGNDAWDPRAADRPMHRTFPDAEPSRDDCHAQALDGQGLDLCYLHLRGQLAALVHRVRGCVRHPYESGWPLYRRRSELFRGRIRMALIFG
jgi:hypothetical protein